MYVTFTQPNLKIGYYKRNCLWAKGGEGADVPLFETIKSNAGTQPKNELQQ